MASRKNDYHSIVAVALSALGVIIALTLLFPERVQEPSRIVLHCGIAAAALVFVVVVSGRLNNPLALLLRMAGIVWLTSFFFDAVAGLQLLIFREWQDAALIRFERVFTGIETSLLLQSWVHPLLTEWLMASYVIYIPLLPLTAWVVFRVGGERPAYEYLFCLLLVNLCCDVGFVLYPIASQLFYDPAQYSVPLVGGPFTWMAEWVRANVHFPGGSFPSPHNAAGTVMFATLWRWNRRWAAAMTPFLLSIPLATVYGRFHYISDSIVGIALALVVLYALRGRAHATAAARMRPRIEGMATESN
ncbi:MAG: phosphatase PAP2 family protein [Bacteroidia bacterium]|nr:phosphatase PAP2 family protein [Bacteroidia bacterium]